MGTNLFLTSQTESLRQFISLYPCSPASPRPNTSPTFRLVDPLQLPLTHSPSLFNPRAWSILLRHYERTLPFQLLLILRFGVMIGYQRPESTLTSQNLRSAFLDAAIIDRKLDEDLKSGRVAPATQSSPFVSSPVGLVLKSNGGLRRIHHLSYPRGQSVNDFIPKEACKLKYATLENIFTWVRRAGRGAVIIKKDIKDAFCNIPVAPHQQWLLGFEWKGLFYQETCLLFGLSTSPFIFNLFGEAFHWMLEAYLDWTESEHYLDDFIRIVQASLATPYYLRCHEEGYKLLTNSLGVPRQESKDCTGTLVSVLGIEIDTNLFIAQIPKEKLEKAKSATGDALSKDSLTLHELQSLTGFFSFCAQVVQLGWVFMRNFWDFIASFPSGVSSFVRRRIPLQVRDDLKWWNELLPVYNGIKFFDTQARVTIQLYTDASLQGLGGFYYEGAKSLYWPTAVPNIPQDQAFAVPITSSVHINIHELEAILLAIEAWSNCWTQAELIIYTDSSTAYNGLIHHILRGDANQILRKILLLTAKHDIRIIPRWIPSEHNGLADALSRFSIQTVANLCSHWQAPWSSIVLPRTS